MDDCNQFREIAIVLLTAVALLLFAIYLQNANGHHEDLLGNNLNYWSCTQYPTAQPDCL